MTKVPLDIGRAAVAFPSRTFFVDVSKHQGSIDWRALRVGGIDYAIIKASQGQAGGKLSFTDPKWKENARGALRAGVRFGAYHYAVLDGGDAAEQAKKLAILVGAANGCRFGALDLEPSTVEALAERRGAAAVERWVRAFVAAWRSVSRLPLVVYLSGKTIRKAAGGLDFLRGFGLLLWWAGYPTPPFSWPSQGPSEPLGYIDGWPVGGWQYAGGDDDRTEHIDEGGKAPGISGDVDCNVCMSSAFEDLFGDGGTIAPLSWLKIGGSVLFGIGLAALVTKL